MSQALDVLKARGFVQQCTDFEGVEKALDTGRVTFYCGVDPTGPSLHAGHLVPYMAMKHLQMAGHRPIVIVGGGTARIGDPSGKTEMRKMQSVEQIQANAASLKKQLSRFIDFSEGRGLMVDNSDWLASLNYIEFLRDIGVHFSVNRMLTFETYKKRLETGLSFIEFNYQLLQSYDFLKLFELHGCTLQIGGDDQWGNIVSGIDLIRRLHGAESYGLTMPLVTRSDGKKMGKTEKGALFIDPELTSVFEFFQYWRNVPDDDVEKFLKLYTFLPLDQIADLCAHKDERINKAKEVLAHEFTAFIHGKEEADKALQAAKGAFAGAGADLDAIPHAELTLDRIRAGVTYLDLFAESGLAPSKREARQLISQGGASVNDQKVADPAAVVEESHVQEGALLLKAGKKRLFRYLVG